MPNQPRPDNPARAIRIDDELWERVGVVADRLHVPRSEVVRDAVAAWVNDERPPATIRR